MAGVKGRSGRKPAPKKDVGKITDDSLDFMRSVMVDASADPKLRLRAAIALAQYEHTKTHDGGKKDAAKDAAKAAAAGKFAPSSAPRLAVSNGKSVESR